MSMILTCACVNRTRRFLRCVSGNCIGLVSLTLHAANPVMFDIACPIEPPADPPINLVTANKMKKKLCYQQISVLYIRDIYLYDFFLSLFLNGIQKSSQIIIIIL